MMRPLLPVTVTLAVAVFLAACSAGKPPTSKEQPMVESGKPEKHGTQPGRLVFRVKGMKKTKSGAT